MSNSGTNITFSFEYAVSIIVVLVVCNLLVKQSPQMNMMIVVIAGLVIGYLTLFFMNNFFPYINKVANEIYQYYTYQMMNNFNNMGYIHIFPPILAILIIFVVLLYNKQLS